MKNSTVHTRFLTLYAEYKHYLAFAIRYDSLYIKFKKESKKIFFNFFYYSPSSQDRWQFIASVGHRTQKIVSFPARKSELLRIAAKQSCRPVVLYFGTPGSNRRQIGSEPNGQNYPQQFVLHEFCGLRVDQWGECTTKIIECDVSDSATACLQQLASIGPAVCWEELAYIICFFFNEFIIF